MNGVFFVIAAAAALVFAALGKTRPALFWLVIAGLAAFRG